MTDHTNEPESDELADGTSYREMADGDETDLGDADGTSYREIAQEDDPDQERKARAGEKGEGQ